jgi:uncharacterized protein involved in cysteine biosynthesis
VARVIFSSFAAALGQIGDKRFQSVLWRGVGLAVALLLAATLGLGWLAAWAASSGPAWLDTLAGAGGLLLGLLASVFLMVPVAAAFSGLFLDDVAEAVEARHYPATPGRSLGLIEGLGDSLGLVFAMLALNLVALALAFFIGPLAPILFWGLNGWLLGKDYFLAASRRHLPRAEARALLSRHRFKVWAAGTLMAAPLSLPLVGLVIPVLGAATFTHLVQRLRNG